MKEVPLRALQALDVDLASCTERDIIGLAHQVRTVRGFLDSFDAGMRRQLKSLKAQGQSSGATPSEVLARASGESTAEGGRRERRADTLDETPSFDDALADGEIVASHVDVLAGFLADLPGDIRAAFSAQQAELLEHARHEDVARFRRRCRDLITRLQHDAGTERARRQRANMRLSHRIDHTTGMYHLSGCFDPETGARLFSNLDNEITALIAANHEQHEGFDRSQLAAHALANLTAPGADTNDDASSNDHEVRDRAPRPANVDLTVHIDWHTVCHGLHEHGICELESGVPIPVDTARRLACNANILPIVLGGDSIPLDHGRGRRQASRTQRRALRAMYPGCAFPGCDRGFDKCEMHHLIEWLDLGNTDLQNLLPLCSYHHHRIHEDHWQLTLAADRTLTVRRPDSTIYAIEPLPARDRHGPPTATTAASPAPEPTRRAGPATADCERPPGHSPERRRSTSNQPAEQLRLT